MTPALQFTISPSKEFLVLKQNTGWSVTGGEHGIDAAHAAAVMFEPVISQSRSTNTYTNGSRLYLDVGSHPGMTTAEARTVPDAVLVDAAGENLMAGLLLQRRTYAA